MAVEEKTKQRTKPCAFLSKTYSNWQDRWPRTITSLLANKGTTVDMTRVLRVYSTSILIKLLSLCRQWREKYQSHLKKKKPQVQRKEQSFTSDLVFLVKSLVKLLLIIQKKNRVTLTPSVAICMIRNGAMHVIDVIPIPLPCQSNAIEITSRIVFPATITYFKCTREICETARRELRIQVFLFLW